MDTLDAWRARGRTLNVCGLDVFVVTAGPDDADECAVVLHGFPSSSHDFHHVVDRLAAKRRVLLFDFPGYGFSAKPADHAYSLFEQADVVCALVRDLGFEHPHLIAHDMGTSVLCELLARRRNGLLPFEPRSVVLSNGSVYIDMARLTPSQRLGRSRLGPLFVRISRFATFRMQLRRILAKPVDDAELEAMWAAIRHDDGHLRLPTLMDYIDERTRFRHRWHGALRALDLPAAIVWGTADPVAVFAIAERLASEIPAARLIPLDGVGHYPQLEDPDAWLAAIEAALGAPNA